MTYRLSKEAERKFSKLRQEVAQEIGRDRCSLSDVICFFHRRLYDLEPSNGQRAPQESQKEPTREGSP